MKDKGRERGNAAALERGVSVISTAILMPLVLIIMVVCFDLGRLFLNGIFAQEVAILAAKLAASSDPNGYAMPDTDVDDLVHGAPDEEAGAENTHGRRQKFWSTLLSPGESKYIGKNYLTDKEKKIFNLVYGYAHELNPRLYFPIPEGLGVDRDEAVLGGRANCSIYFRYAPGSEIPSPFPQESAPTYETEMSANRDRVFYVDCAVPLVALSLGGILESARYRVISRSAYAYRSGNIKRAG